jgi:hypothetical protein
MQDTILTSSRDIFLVGVPFIAILMACFLRLDEIITASKPGEAKRSRRPISGVDDNGEQILCDPDGRPWFKPRLNK